MKKLLSLVVLSLVLAFFSGIGLAEITFRLVHDSKVEAQTGTIVLSAPFQTTVGTTPIQLPDTGIVRGVTLKAISPGNTLYFGSTNAVNNSTGFPLSDGDSINLEVSNANRIWIVSTATNQKVAVLPYRRQ